MVKPVQHEVCRPPRVKTWLAVKREVEVIWRRVRWEVKEDVIEVATQWRVRRVVYRFLQESRNG